MVNGKKQSEQIIRSSESYGCLNTKARDNHDAIWALTFAVHGHKKVVNNDIITALNEHSSRNYV